jgi:hypothetical protein
MTFSMDKMVIRNQQGHCKLKVSVAFGLLLYECGTTMENYGLSAFKF